MSGEPSSSCVEGYEVSTASLPPPGGRSVTRLQVFGIPGVELRDFPTLCRRNGRSGRGLRRTTRSHLLPSIHRFWDSVTPRAPSAGKAAQRAPTDGKGSETSDVRVSSRSGQRRSCVLVFSLVTSEVATYSPVAADEPLPRRDGGSFWGLGD